MNHQNHSFQDINKIVSLLSELKNKVQLDDTLNYVPEEQLMILENEVRSLADVIHSHHETSPESRTRLENITDTITAIAGMDFSKEAMVSDPPINHFDFVGLGLNLLRYQLQKEFESLKFQKYVFNAIRTPMIVTNNDCRILFINDVLNEMSVFNMKSFVGQDLIKVLSENNWFEKVSFTFETAKNKNTRYHLVFDSNFTSIEDENKNTIGRIYSFEVNRENKSSKTIEHNDFVNRIKSEFDSFQHKLSQEFEKGVTKSDEKERFLLEMYEGLKEKKGLSTEDQKLTVKEQAWLNTLEHLLS